MTRAWWAAAVYLTSSAAPVAAQQTGSVGIHGGLSASGPGLAATANFQAEFGRFSLGLEGGAAGLGDGTDVWHAGGAFGLRASSGTIRPHATLGVARYSWKWCAGCLRAGILGISLGAGGWLARPASRVSLGAELRWHRQVQSVVPEEMSFVTATLGLSLRW